MLLEIPTEQPPNGKNVSSCESNRRTGIDTESVDRSVEKPANLIAGQGVNFRTDQAGFRFGSDAD